MNLSFVRKLFFPLLVSPPVGSAFHLTFRSYHRPFLCPFISARNLAIEMGSPNGIVDKSFHRDDVRGRSHTAVSLSKDSSPFSDVATEDYIATEISSLASPPWKAYPSWQYEKLVERHGSDKIKLIYLVRHAEGTHNVNREYKDIAQLDARLTDKGKDQCRDLRDELLKCGGTNSTTKTLDTDNHRHGLHHLLCDTDTEQEATDSGSYTNDICVVTSPLSRCVETALLSFDFLVNTENGKDTTRKVPFLAHESLRETLNYNCDRRRPISEIARDFPQVDFSHCSHDDDVLWSTLLSIDRYQQEHQEGGRLESAELHLVAQRAVEAIAFLQSLSHSKVVVCTHSAYLRCLLSWGHPGGVPLMVEQRLDKKEIDNRQSKILEYSCVLQEEADIQGNNHEVELEPGLDSFERYMRKDYANAELRSFCLLGK